jgi:hypothetical protein
LSARLSIILKHSSAYHPETNGQTERINAIFKQYLRAYMNFRQNNWVDWLPLAEFALNNAVSETTGFSPFFANYRFNSKLGFEPRPFCSSDKILQQKREFIKAHNIADRFDRILTQIKALIEDTNRRYKNQANQSKTNAPRYKISDQIWISTKYIKTNKFMKKKAIINKPALMLLRLYIRKLAP